MAQVTLKHVDKIYPGGVKAVADFNLEIRNGEFVVLVGPSGCGKSTLLRMVAGLEEITEGTIQIGERVVNDVPPKDRDIAMVFQNYALYPHMTVRENMAFGLKLRKFPKQEIESRVGEAAAILGLGELLDRRPKALSGGQRQRVAVGRAIVRKPEVFLFDEPLSNLDAKMRAQMRVEISRLHQQIGATMIYVTHDQIEAMTMGERIVVMKDGVAQQIDNPMRMYDFPANRFVASFIGTPQMNFFDARIRSVGGSLVVEGPGDSRLPVLETQRSALAAYRDKPVILGLRPEDIGSTAAEQLAGAPRMRAKVEIIEPMGAESYVHFDLGGTPFISRVDAHVKFQIGQVAELAVFIGKAHFFDPQTECRIETASSDGCALK
ncbi:MAG: sn-glycerol-3-phosphate ABC transporter ATP-binding protein UgpC [Lentisphaerae bacterium]|nr:sn-glycerol-3-phosphate ABC transporter ATP-binding protein UgpC [Lentisphaerota bacterium]